jgi:hypothetical protein
MRTITIALALALAGAGASMAQEWELGGMASYGFYRNATATSPSGTADAGFSPGIGFGGVFGHSSRGRLSGEFRYTYLDSDLKLASGGTSANFNGVAHAITYEVLLHPRLKEGSKVQPFLAAGGGMKLYRGTGNEVPFQLLDNIALLTKTQEAKPLISVGGGVKIVLTPHVLLRAEMRDYITPFPKQVITPLPGTKISSWLNNFVPMVGISYIF